MKINLYDYQKQAIERLRTGSILCGGVGSGKSRTALAYFLLKECGLNEGFTKKLKNLYIITTAMKRDSLEWERECAGVCLSTNSKISIFETKVTIDSWNNIKKYVDVKDAFFIFDEQRVVGYGVWTKSFLKITKNNHWILLSATPGDRWEDYIPVFIANGFYKNKTDFTQNHVIYSRFTKYPKVDRYVNTRKLVRLRDSILIPMDFHRKTVAHHEVLFANYDIHAYKQVTKTRWDPFKDEPIQNASGLCYIWRKIVNSSDSRQVLLLELYEKHPKMIIFYNFDYELEILKDIFNEICVEVAEWNGHKHQPVPEGKRWVYLVQYNAGSEGWNCVKTDTIVFYSQNYSYRIMEQAAGRIDRLNTPYIDLYYYHLKSKAPIDLAISRALKEKKNFNEGKFVNW